MKLFLGQKVLYKLNKQDTMCYLVNFGAGRQISFSFGQSQASYFPPFSVILC